MVSMASTTTKKDVNLQDQTSRAVILYFNKITNSTTLGVTGVENAYTITVSDTAGFTDGAYVILFDILSNNYSFYNQVGAAVGNVITLDTPLDYAYPAGTSVDVGIRDLSVDGSGTAQVFGLRGSGSPPGVTLTIDITRIILSCVTDTPVDLTKFGDIAALTRGLVLRTRNDKKTNLFNVKSNAEIAGLAYDWTPETALNPAQGVDGFISRLNFAGQEKIGVAIRLPVGEDLELLVQDDLTDITTLYVVAEGHEVV